MITTTRNADLSSLVSILTEQQARKLDVVAPAVLFRAENGVIRVNGTSPILTEDGVTIADGLYQPTAVFDSGVAEKLGIPVSYVRRMRSERPDLYDANVNGWLHGTDAVLGAWGEPDADGNRTRDRISDGAPADTRSFLLRLFRGDPYRGVGSVLAGGQPGTGVGVARALLSDRYATADHLDVLMSTLDGIKEAGLEVLIPKADLTDRRMVVKITAPSVATEARELLRGYRSPFSGQTGDECPIVFAGLRITNSETGDGAFSITPEVTVQVCDNGMTMTKDVLRQTHLGGRLEQGTVRWAEDTERKNLELVKAKARDAVATFLSPGYLADAVARLERRSGEQVATSEDAVRDLTKPLGYTQEHIAGIMDHFVRGGQFTRGGVVNAITAYSQTIEDADAAHELDVKATSLLGV